MPVSATDLMRAKLQGIRTTLQRTPPSDKKERVSIALIDDFNAILASAGQEFPDIATALPKAVSTRGVFARVGTADISFLDLEALIEQVLNLLALVDSK